MKRSSRADLSLETLEERCTPAAVLTVGHNLWITGTDAADKVSVRDTMVGSVKSVEVTEQTGTGIVKTTTFPKSALTGGYVYFYGYKGDDQFTNRASLQVVAYGGPGNDTLTSTTGGYFYGEAGNDVIDCSAANGVRVIDGGEGNDVLYGSTGNDYITGGLGNDTIYAGAGDDYVEGGEGNDTIEGGLGSDNLKGNAGNDVIYAGPVNDFSANVVDGGAGGDRLYGGSGNDIFLGGNEDASTNWIYGGAGNDGLYGGQGTDYLYGEDGNDTLVGGMGNDTLVGGKGVDILFGQEGNDFLDGGIDGSIDQLIGGAGNNTYHDELYWNGMIFLSRDTIYGFDVSRDVRFT